MTAVSFTCPSCGMTSHNPNDAANRYCGNCHVFIVESFHQGPAADRVLPIIVIYRNPLDYPHKFVTRRQWACRGGGVEVEDEPLAVVDTVDQARAAVPPECDTRLDRDPADDPAIIEVWL